MKTITFTIYPYATCYGSIKVPDELPIDEYARYIEEHFDYADISSPELDYCGCDITDIEEQQ